MKTIKTLSLALAASFVLAGSALAAKNPSSVDTPRGSNGSEAHPWNAGYIHARIVNTIGESLVCSGRCLIGALILNTGPKTTQVTLRNTSAVNGSGAIVLRHKFETINTEPGNNPIRLPILVDKGITAQLNNAGEEEVTVLYRDLD